MKIKRNDIIEVKVDSISFGGSGFAKYDDIAIFIDKALPGQKLKVKLFKKYKSYFKAGIVEIIDETPFSLDPKCIHFNDCGGCSFQNFDYKEQLKQKEIQVKDTLSHIGNLKSLKVNPILGAKEQFNYRNKMEFTFSSNQWFEKHNPKEKKELCLGLHPKGRFDKTINLESCQIQSNIANKIMNTARDVAIKSNLIPYDIRKHKGFLRQLVIRSADYNNETMVIIVTSKNDQKKLEPLVKELIKINEIKSIINNVNSRKADVSYSNERYLLHGDEFITEKIGQYKFKISADSFFQTNSKQTKKLYDIIKKEANLKGEEIVYDLYCGTGTIGIYLSSKAKKVFGFEIISSAIDDAIINADNNKVRNALFFQGDIKDVLTDNQEIKTIEKPDISIVDPPRSGLHPKALKNIIKLDQKKIIYISCNPSTQARDLKELISHGYKVKNIQPVDMFPHTPHIESVVTLTK